MRTRRLALAALLPLTAFLTMACGGTTAPSAGAAYGTTSAASATPSASAGAPMIPAKTMLTLRKTKIGYVLATATGMTVYWYGKDVKGSGLSACASTCLTAWPAVTGTPAVAAGVRLTDKLGTITRGGGVVQATYNGYPLYTYAADGAAGQTNGNGFGGLWHVFTGTQLSPSPATAAAASAHGQSAATSSSSATSSASTSGY